MGTSIHMFFSLSTSCRIVLRRRFEQTTNGRGIYTKRPAGAIGSAVSPFTLSGKRQPGAFLPHLVRSFFASHFLPFCLGRLEKSDLSVRPGRMCPPPLIISFPNGTLRYFDDPTCPRSSKPSNQPFGLCNPFIFLYLILAERELIDESKSEFDNSQCPNHKVEVRHEIL